MHRATFLALFLLLAPGCVAEMGGLCEQSSACADGGLCLKGVCSGYACAIDDDCDDGFVCGSVNGALACVVPCETDDGCEGTQTCEDVAESLEAGAATNPYCM